MFTTAWSSSCSNSTVWKIIHRGLPRPIRTTGVKYLHEKSRWWRLSLPRPYLRMNRLSIWILRNGKHRDWTAFWRDPDCRRVTFIALNRKTDLRPRLPRCTPTLQSLSLFLVLMILFFSLKRTLNLFAKAKSPLHVRIYSWTIAVIVPVWFAWRIHAMFYFFHVDIYVCVVLVLKILSFNLLIVPSAEYRFVLSCKSMLYVIVEYLPSVIQ